MLSIYSTCSLPQLLLLAAETLEKRAGVHKISLLQILKPLFPQKFWTYLFHHQYHQLCFGNDKQFTVIKTYHNTRVNNGHADGSDRLMVRHKYSNLTRSLMPKRMLILCQTRETSQLTEQTCNRNSGSCVYYCIIKAKSLMNFLWCDCLSGYSLWWF